MIDKAKRLALCAGLSLYGLVCLPACSGPVDSIEPPATDSPSALASVSDHPAPVVTIGLDEGNVLELYEIDGAVLLSEVGKAGTPTVRQRMPLAWAALQTNRFVEAFAALRPGSPVPAALLDLQARHPERVEPELAAGAPPPVTTRPMESSGGVQPSGLASCSNDCCDYNWLQYNLCYGTSEVTWFYYEYGWSWQDGHDLNYLWTAACAISGTSQFSVSTSLGEGGSWSVPEGYYRTFNWYNDNTLWSMSSKVNSQSDEHLHTYCGGDGQGQ